MPYFVGQIENIRDLKNMTKPSPNYYLKKYIPSGGYFYNNFLDCQLFIENDVKTASRTGVSVPWFAEIFMTEFLEDLEKNNYGFNSRLRNYSLTNFNNYITFAIMQCARGGHKIPIKIVGIISQKFMLPCLKSFEKSV
jgi:hypothetical protein